MRPPRKSGPTVSWPDWTGAEGGMGSGRDPLAIEVGVRALKDGDPHWFNIFELYEDAIPTPDLIHAVHEIHTKFKVQRFWCGQEQFWAVNLLASRGLPALSNLVTGPGSLEFGLRTLYSLLAKRRWTNDPDACPRLQEEFTRFRWGTDRTGQPTGKVKDDHDHGISAVRYYLTGEGEVPEAATASVPLEQQPTLRRGLHGELYDNPRATQAVRAMRSAMTNGMLLPPLWDEQPEVIGGVDHLKKVWRMLTGRELELPE